MEGKKRNTTSNSLTDPSSATTELALIVCAFNNYILDYFVGSKVLGINHDHDDERDLLPCFVLQS